MHNCLFRIDYMLFRCCRPAVLAHWYHLKHDYKDIGSSFHRLLCCTSFNSSSVDASGHVGTYDPLYYYADNKKGEDVQYTDRMRLVQFHGDNRAFEHLQCKLEWTILVVSTRLTTLFTTYLKRSTALLISDRTDRLQATIDDEMLALRQSSHIMSELLRISAAYMEHMWNMGLKFSLP